MHSVAPIEAPCGQPARPGWPDSPGQTPGQTHSSRACGAANRTHAPPKLTRLLARTPRARSPPSARTAAQAAPTTTSPQPPNFLRPTHCRLPFPSSRAASALLQRGSARALHNTQPLLPDKHVTPGAAVAPHLRGVERQPID
eukprot:351487-Chlamydomonas_euryale.AAC.10